MLRLKEDPREWQKFAAVMGVVANLIVWMLWWRGLVPIVVPLVVATLALTVLIAALIRPRRFRGFYRAGMTASYHIGQIAGKILLTAIFLLLVTPMGLLLRLMGKDLLALKRSPAAKTWWQPARDNRDFDRMF
jgi:hypothetical protein